MELDPDDWSYDPEQTPDPAWWLELDEDESAMLVVAHHEDAGVDLPGLMMHARIHVSIENQIAEGVPTVVETLARLQYEGLSRHDALHAMGVRLLETFQRLMDGERDGMAWYEAQLRELTAAQWLALAVEEPESPKARKKRRRS